jgi:hypothetical protein
MKLAFLIVLVFIATYFRVAVVEQTHVLQPLMVDSGEYYVTGYNLRYHGIYSRAPENPVPDDYRAPGLPLMFAAVMGDGPVAAVVGRMQALNIVLGVSTVALVFWASAVMLPVWAAFLVGLLVAASPHLLSLTVYLLTEVPTTFFLSAVLAVAALMAPQRLTFALLGALVGCSSLFRPVFLGFVPYLALAYPRGQRRSCLIYACLGAALVVAPWFVRNVVNVSGVDQANNFAENLLQGTYHDAKLYPWEASIDPIYPVVTKNLALTAIEVGKRIWAEPLPMLRWYFLEKPVYLFQWDEIGSANSDVFIYPVWSTPFWTDAVFKAIHDVFRYTWAATLGLAALGALFAMGSRRIDLRAAALMLVFVYLVHVPFPSYVRYVIPIFPAIYLLAVCALVAMVLYIKGVIHEGRANNYGGVSGAGARLRL